MNDYEQLEKMAQEGAEMRSELAGLMHEHMQSTHESIQHLLTLSMIQAEQIRRLEADVEELKKQIKN